MQGVGRVLWSSSFSSAVSPEEKGKSLLGWTWCLGAGGARQSRGIKSWITPWALSFWRLNWIRSMGKGGHGDHEGHNRVIEFGKHNQPLALLFLGRGGNSIIRLVGWESTQAAKQGECLKVSMNGVEGGWMDGFHFDGKVRI